MATPERDCPLEEVYPDEIASIRGYLEGLSNTTAADLSKPTHQALYDQLVEETLVPPIGSDAWVTVQSWAQARYVIGQQLLNGTPYWNKVVSTGKYIRFQLPKVNELVAGSRLALPTRLEQAAYMRGLGGRPHIRLHGASPSGKESEYPLAYALLVDAAHLGALSFSKTVALSAIYSPQARLNLSSGYRAPGNW